MAASNSIPDVNHASTWYHRGIFYLSAAFIFSGAALRAILFYQESPLLRPVLFLLAAGLLIFTGESLLSKQARWLPPLLLGGEVMLVLALLRITGSDFFAVLFALPSMQAMRRFAPRTAIMLIGLTGILSFLTLMQSYGGLQAMALTLAFSALSAFMAAYVWAARRADAVNNDLQALTGKLQSANRQLEIYSQQQAQLAASRERHGWARELHDSVTQTIFSLSLAARAAVLLLEHDRAQVHAQLDRIDQLAQNTLAEMQVLIHGLAPAGPMDNGFLEALRQHLTDRAKLENLEVRLEVEGCGPLSPMEEWGLLRIAREALNNIVKYARVSQAVLRLHLIEPFWMEIEDHGHGFDIQMPRLDTQLGLANMHERAAEMGWDLEVSSSPGAGTCVRAKKRAEGHAKP